VREAVEAKQWTAAAAHMKPLAQALAALAERVENAAKLLGGS
jgi:hypothetical protein